MKQIIVGVMLLAGTMAGADERAQRLLEKVADVAPGGATIYFAQGAQGMAITGERAWGSDVTVAPGDLWHIGSNTKALTATLVARLAEAGQLSLDDNIGTVLKDLLPDLHPDHASTTYAELLSHRAGIAPDPPLALRLKLQGAEAARDAPADRRIIAAQLLSAPRRPEGFLYSNGGYLVAAAMIEATTGKSWSSLMKRHVFAPLGMDSAGFGPPGVAGDVTQPRGHQAGGPDRFKPVEPGANADNIPAYGPAGRVHLSASDQMRFLLVHLHEDPAFLTPESWAWLHQPVDGADYVAGWGRKGTTLFHSGSNTMWYATVALDLDLDRAVAIFANAATQKVMAAVDMAARDFMRGE